MQAALLTLFKANTVARVGRIRTGFSTPRRTLLSALVIVLAIVWLGQTVASMLLREPYAPDVFRRWVAVPLFAWFLWHLIRVAWKRPETPVEWSDAEESLIAAGPFTPQEQLIYRFVVILTATLPKALLTLFVLWPDLSWSSPVGLILALVALEMFRVVTDIGTCCLTVRGYRAYRCGIVAIIVLLAFVWQPTTTVQHDPTTTQEVISLARSQQATHYIDAILQNEAVSTLGVPFLCAADVIATRGTTSSLLVKISAMIATLYGMAWFIGRLEKKWRFISIQRERQLWQETIRTQGGENTLAAMSGVSATADTCLPRIPFCGPLIWRQWRRAMRYCGSLVVSMAIPAILLCPPLLTVNNSVVAFLLVVSGALFYTFVLLPEAIKFDFRLDSDHLCHLKMLPMTPSRVVLGQLAIPVLLACLFQAVVIVAAGMYRTVDVPLIVAGLAMSLPLTILFVALDNLIFLLYPHRPTQEGFEAFLRTILKFTGKSVLLALFAGAIFVWAPVAAAVADAIGDTVSSRSIFVTGLIVGISSLAVAAFGCVVSAFRRFDVSLHSVG